MVKNGLWLALQVTVVLCRPMLDLRSAALRSGLAAVVLVGSAGLLLAQCRKPDPAPTPDPVPPSVTTPTVPTAVPALARADLVNASQEAANAYAEGTPVTGTDPLVGRTFAVRIPFACGPLPDGGPSAAAQPDGLARAIWGPERKTIQISLTPGDWTQSALMAEPNAAARWEQVEGFWVTRPWLTGDSCPTLPVDPLLTAVPQPTPQTLGIAAVFEEGASRFGRRNGRAYAYTVRGEGDQPAQAPAGGYRLLLEGRVTGFPSGRAFRCRASGPDQRPVCVIAVQLDRVAMTHSDGTVMGEWHGA